MKTIPVTPELIVILENAKLDSLHFISECEEELEHYENNALKLVLAGIERRKQLLAVINDLLDRFT